MDQCMSRAQKGTGSYTRGVKHQLLVKRAVTHDCKFRSTKNCDYNKVYHSVPHTWIQGVAV